MSHSDAVRGTALTKNTTVALTTSLDVFFFLFDL
jgi:hypothetical protein